jgi:hypothetical protein
MPNHLAFEEAVTTILIKAIADRISCIKQHPTAANIHPHSQTITCQAPYKVPNLRWARKFPDFSPNCFALVWFSHAAAAFTFPLIFHLVLFII